MPVQINEEALKKALMRFQSLGGGLNAHCIAAIEAYLMEAFKPGPIIELSTAEFIPPAPRDYRKELWIAHWHSMPAEQDFKVCVMKVQRAVKAFDEFFAKDNSHE